MEARKVLNIARSAILLNARALPALNPNQPAQRSIKPTATSVKLWGWLVPQGI
jgi:hypothetical protein